MAIDPTAPLTPILPSAPAGAAPDSLAVLQAMARQALANTAAELGQIVSRPAAPQAPRTGAPVEQAGRTSTQDAGHTDDAANAAKGAPTQPTPARGTPETRMARAVRMAAAEAVPRQAGLAPLMANVRAAVDRDDMPTPVREAGGVLLAVTPHADEITTAQGLRRAVEHSGVFLEARMARAATPAGPGGASTPSPGGDMKAALLVFRGALSAWLANAIPHETAEPVTDAAPDAEPPAPEAEAPAADGASSATPAPGRSAPQVQANAAKPLDDAPDGAPSTLLPPKAELSAEGVPVKPGVPSLGPEPESNAPLFAAFTAAPKPAPSPTAAARASLSSLIQAGLLLSEDAVAEEPTAGPVAEAKTVVARGYGESALDVARSKLPPPPYASGPMAGQRPTLAVLSVDQSPVDAVRGLLKGANGALARQELMQIASLSEPQRLGEVEAAEARPQGARLNLDLPFVTPQGVAVAQFEISHDGGGSGGGAIGSVERTYKARFSIDLEPLGPVHALVTLTGARARVSLWAERAETIARLRAGEESLGAALRQAELAPEVAIHSGAPFSVGGASPLGHFVDQAS